MHALLDDLIIDNGHNKNDSEQDQGGGGSTAFLGHFQCVVNEADHGIQTAGGVGGAHGLAEDTDDGGVLLEAADETGDDDIGQHGAQQGNGDVGEHTGAGSAVDLVSNLVIIPTYNEKENIEAIITAVMELPIEYHVLVIDDGSPDGTADIVKDLMTNKFAGKLHIVERSGKLGLGTAYIAGFKWAIEHKYDYIFEMDADFSHNPQDLLKLYDACANQGADVAIGSRYVSGVNVVNWPMGRVLMSYFASKYVRFVLGVNIHDTTAGFKCYRREVLETIELDKIRFKGYAFQIEMKFTAYKCGFKIQEVPIIFVNRVLGTSKMSGGIFSEALLGVIKLKLNSWTRKYPQKK